MSFGISVKALDIAGGAQLAGGQQFFKVDGQPVVVTGDQVASHGAAQHASAVMVEGSTWMRINGVAVCREGNAASCGDLTTGRIWFRIPH